MEELYPLLEEAFAGRTNEEWMGRLRAEDLIYAPVLTYEQLACDEQARVNDYIVTVDHPSLGQIDVTGMPITFSSTPVEIGNHAPELGQHAEEVLLGLGYDWDQITRFREEAVIH
ncbi:MAG: hypothetical protein GEU28_06425 [Dehalococcoidia bacterium]|nr:hypothetical protein [Dehalococcoidia bacterium]